jgi:MFS family permease
MNVMAASRKYLTYLVILMGLVAMMDQYLSTIKTTAIPYILEEYQISAERFSWLESLFLASTFFVFLLNGLNDLIGRRLSILVLLLMMGLASLGLVMFTPMLTWFMVLYAAVTFTTVSNMWTIPISEEAPDLRRARLVSIVYVIGLLPLQALLPPLLLNVLKLDWKWMYGAGFILMLPVLALWLFMHETNRFQVIQQERRQGLRKRHLFGLGVINRSDIRYIAISAGIWICWLIVSFIYFWAGYYFMNIKGYSLAQWSLVLLASLLMAILGGITGGWIMDRAGRRTTLIAGCLGLTITMSLLGFASGPFLPVAAALTGFFVSFSYSWIVVYVPEIFPTERRGTCMGWTTTAARIAYVVGPAYAALLLRAFPTMEWYWVAGGLVMLLPVLIISLFQPSETRVKSLELIEVER